MKLILPLALLIPLLHAQTLCPVLQGSSLTMCTDACIEEMQHVVSLSGGSSDYRNYLRNKYEEFFWSDSQGCIYIFCGFVHQSYGIFMTRDTCT